VHITCTAQTMAGLKNSCAGFAYAIDFKDGGYVLNITNAAAILAPNEVTGKIEFDLNRCPPLCPNLPYAEINVTIPIADGTEPAIMRMQSGPKGGSVDPRRWSQSSLNFFRGRVYILPATCSRRFDAPSAGLSVSSRPLKERSARSG